MKSLDYRGHRSTTLWLVLFIWAVTTGLLLAGILEAEHWVTVTMGGVFGWVLRDGVTKAAEAYRDKS